MRSSRPPGESFVQTNRCWPAAAERGVRPLHMSFEIIFITEGPESVPAAEIQFGGQRLCNVRFSPAGAPQIEFVQDLYVGGDVEMVFPFAEFQTTVQLAIHDLAAWLQKLADGPTEA